MSERLSHIDDQGRARMVDVTAKDDTLRVATARGRVLMQAATLRLILAGDANLRPGAGATYLRLRDEGFSEPLAGSIDQIVVRGLPSTPPRAWAEERRRLGDRVLSDHAPVELTVG